jgi:hypothetical protein
VIAGIELLRPPRTAAELPTSGGVTLTAVVPLLEACPRHSAVDTSCAHACCLTTPSEEAGVIAHFHDKNRSGD